MEELWTPKKVVPDIRKDEGGSYFDDEMEDTKTHQQKFREAVIELVKHINARPDHTVFVASADERTKMRVVFNSWREGGLIQSHPTIKIDYGVPDGTIRVDEDRS